MTNINYPVVYQSIVPANKNELTYIFNITTEEILEVTFAQCILGTEGFSVGYQCFSDPNKQPTFCITVDESFQETLTASEFQAILLQRQGLIKQIKQEPPNVGQDLIIYYISGSIEKELQADQYACYYHDDTDAIIRAIMKTYMYKYEYAYKLDIAVPHYHNTLIKGDYISNMFKDQQIKKRIETIEDFIYE